MSDTEIELWRCDHGFLEVAGPYTEMRKEWRFLHEEEDLEEYCDSTEVATVSAEQLMDEIDIDWEDW